MTFFTSGSAASFVGGVLLTSVAAIVIACVMRWRPTRDAYYHRRRQGTVMSSSHDEGVAMATTGCEFHATSNDGYGQADGRRVNDLRLSSKVTCRPNDTDKLHSDNDSGRRQISKMADILLQSMYGPRDRKGNTDANDNEDEEYRTVQPFPDAMLKQPKGPDNLSLSAKTAQRRTTLQDPDVSSNLSKVSSSATVDLDQLRAQLALEQDRRTLAEDWSVFLMATLRAYLSARDAFVHRPRRGPLSRDCVVSETDSSSNDAQVQTKLRTESMNSIRRGGRDVMARNVTSSHEHVVSETSLQLRQISDDGASELCYERWLAKHFSTNSVSKDVVKPESDEEFAEWEEAVSYNEMILHRSSTTADKIKRWHQTSNFKLSTASGSSALRVKNSSGARLDERRRSAEVERETHLKDDIIDGDDDRAIRFDGLLGKKLTTSELTCGSEQLLTMPIDDSISKQQDQQMNQFADNGTVEKCMKVASETETEEHVTARRSASRRHSESNDDPSIEADSVRDRGLEAVSSDSEDAEEIWKLSVRDRVKSWREGRPCPSLTEVSSRQQQRTPGHSSDTLMTSAMTSRTSDSISHLCSALSPSSVGPSFVTITATSGDIDAQSRLTSSVIDASGNPDNATSCLPRRQTATSNLYRSVSLRNLQQ